MRIDPSGERAQANEPKDAGFISRSLLRFIESRAGSGVYTFDFAVRRGKFFVLDSALTGLVPAGRIVLYGFFHCDPVFCPLLRGFE